MSAPTTPPAQTPVSDHGFRFRSTGISSEWAESYHPGGLHPVHLDDVFNNRYRVIRKLGNGAFATVWMAIDSVLARYVALKIGVANRRDERQIAIHQALASKLDTDSKFLVALLDSFLHRGPNGEHLCLVLELMGPSLSFILNKPMDEILDLHNIVQPRRLSKQLTKQVLRNVLSGLRFLHGNGVVHGDIQAGNMLFAIKDLASVSPEILRQDESSIKALERIDGKIDRWAPSYLAAALPLTEYVLEGPDQTVKLIDMGSAFFAKSPPQFVETPAALRAPELILGCPFGNGIDIWSLGCLLFEFLTGLPLFQIPPISGRPEVMIDYHLIQMTDVIHPLPETLLEKWTRAGRYFGPDGERLDCQPRDFDGSDSADSDFGGDDDEGYDDDSVDMEEDDLGEHEPPQRHDSLENLFRANKTADIDEEEASEITGLLRWILQYDATKRPSATELLEHPWIKLD